MNFNALISPSGAHAQAQFSLSDQKRCKDTTFFANNHYITQKKIAIITSPSLPLPHPPSPSAPRHLPGSLPGSLPVISPPMIS